MKILFLHPTHCYHAHLDEKHDTRLHYTHHAMYRTIQHRLVCCECTFEKWGRCGCYDHSY